MCKRCDVLFQVVSWVDLVSHPFSIQASCGVFFQHHKKWVALYLARTPRLPISFSPSCNVSSSSGISWMTSSASPVLGRRNNMARAKRNIRPCRMVRTLHVLNIYLPGYNIHNGTGQNNTPVGQSICNCLIFSGSLWQRTQPNPVRTYVEHG